MSRMPSPMDQLKVRIAFTPATMRKRCAVCVHSGAVNGPAGFYNMDCGKHGLLTTGFSICKDFFARHGAATAKDPC